MSYFQVLKELTRERSTLMKDKAALSSRRHASSYSANPLEFRQRLMKQRWDLLKAQIKELDKEIKAHLNSKKEAYKEIVRKIKKVC